MALTAGQPVVRLAGSDDREITIDLTEQSVASPSVGTLFDAILVANPEIKTQVGLTRIDPVAAASTRTRRAHLALTNPPVGFRLGTLVRMVPTASADITLSLDVATILDANGAPAVWVVDRATNTVHRTAIELGETFGSRVRVTSGLSKNDEVVTKGISSLEDGQLVGPRIPE